MEDKVVNLKQGLAVGEPHPEASMMRAQMHDPQKIDQVSIKLIPTFFQDKWHTTARVSLLIKGKIVSEVSYRDMTIAAALLSAEILNTEHNEKLDNFCDQEGCNNTATVAYRMIKAKCARCGKSENLTVGFMRKFCEEHKERGNNQTDDSMSNYELIT